MNQSVKEWGVAIFCFAITLLVCGVGGLFILVNAGLKGLL